jgi:hypothetical protein
VVHRTTGRNDRLSLREKIAHQVESATYFAGGMVVRGNEMKLSRVTFDHCSVFPVARITLFLISVSVLVACKADPLKDWSNSKLIGKAAECAAVKKHNPRSGMICSQVLESCSFRGISCR